jgi:hypothetical protein
LIDFFLSGNRARLALIVLALIGVFVLAKCGEGGMYQGGGEDTPGWR